MSENGSRIRMDNGKLTVPNDPIIPFIEGDGIGPDIWRSAVRVFDAAIEKAYNNERKIHWLEVYAGEKAFKKFNNWLPDETIEKCKEYLVSIKGPLSTPIGGGMRSLNVALRQLLDLYVCLRPVRWYRGVPSPIKCPENVDMVIFRENTEDIYAGIEFEQGTEPNQRFLSLFKESFPEEYSKIRFPETSGIGIKTISIEGSERLLRSAFEYAIENNRKTVTLVHKGNIMKFTEGAFRDWGYELSMNSYDGELLDGGPWVTIKNPNNGKNIIVKDVICDAFLQQILTRPKEYDVIATMNLNGDYVSDALAACVGGIGIAPGANIGDDSALFEATHGTAPKYAGQDKVNPGSLILSAEMMLRHMGWVEAADLIISSMEAAITDKMVTYDFERLMDGANLVSCSGFAKEMIKRM